MSLPCRRPHPGQAGGGRRGRCRGGPAGWRCTFGGGARAQPCPSCACDLTGQTRAQTTGEAGPTTCRPATRRTGRVVDPLGLVTEPGHDLPRRYGVTSPRTGGCSASTGSRRSRCSKPRRPTHPDIYPHATSPPDCSSPVEEHETAVDPAGAPRLRWVAEYYPVTSAAEGRGRRARRGALQIADPRLAATPAAAAHTGCRHLLEPEGLAQRFTAATQSALSLYNQPGVR